jgi:hypothetical protein
MLKRIEKVKDNYTKKHGVIPNKIKMSPTLYMMFNGKEKIADMYIVVTTELDYVFELAYEIYLNKGEEDSVNNKLDLSSIPTILQEIYKEIEALKEQGKTPTNVLMSERTYKTISPDYEVGEITGCFGLPLEISNSIRKYQVCFDRMKIKERMRI